jgi:dihydrofolate reductase
VARRRHIADGSNEDGSDDSDDSDDSDGGSAMTKVAAHITTSLDGYVTGPGDGPDRGLGVGGERLHYWVFGGPWSYDAEPTGGPTGVDRELLDKAMAEVGAVIVGRTMYEAAGAWGGNNPWDRPLFVVTHRPGDQPPPERGFTFVDGLETALDRAREAAGDKTVSIGGGADVIRQALAADHLDELAVSIAPVVLGGGKRLFDGFDRTVLLDRPEVVESPWAVHLRYRVVR